MFLGLYTILQHAKKNWRLNIFFEIIIFLEELLIYLPKVLAQCKEINPSIFFNLKKCGD